jgi:CheY-like chemotaxis protein
MPEMDGYEVIQKFRELFPTVPVIAMTGGMGRKPEGPYLEIAQKFGAKWILPKPFSSDQFGEVIRAATGEKPAA